MSKRSHSHTSPEIKRRKEGSVGKEFTAEDKFEVVLNVLLNCEQTKSSVAKQVHFHSLPTTPLACLEIKKKIEEDFSIPSCVQTLHYQSMTLKDSDQLQRTHFRSGDTFTVDYPIEAECEMAGNVIKWLKELSKLLESINQSLDEGSDLLIFSKIDNLILEGERDNSIEALARTLFAPWNDKQKSINQLYFQQEGGLDVLMKVYGILVSKEWGGFGMDEEVHIDLEDTCSMAVCNYAQSFVLRRQVVQLGGLEMLTTTLLRRQIQGCEYYFGTLIYNVLGSALYALCNLSEVPDYQVPLAMRTDVIDQILAIAMHPAYDCNTAAVSVAMIQCLTQSPEAHVYIARKETVENMLQMCELRQKMVSDEQSLAQEAEKEHAVMINTLKCYTSIALAQVGLGSPHLLTDSIPPHLLQQILNLISDVLESASPAEIRRYEEKEEFTWGTFLPYLRYLYKPSNVTAEDFAGGDVETNLHISWCNILLYLLENSLGREYHLKILVKEGLLDYIMCLPAVLPGECQPRARSLVNELGKHRQLQPPSLCTLAKAHIAKAFCGLQPVMEMNSIGDFLQMYFSTN